LTVPASATGLPRSAHRTTGYDDSPRQELSVYYLHCLGNLTLTTGGGAAVTKLRKKDLALLVYLRLEGNRAHSRAFLSSLLWGEHPQDRARHSLTQALARLRAVFGADAMVLRNDHVEWRGPLECDAHALEEAYAGDRPRHEFVYGGDFLLEFEPGGGAQDFQTWAQQRRARYRGMVLQVLETWGADAELRGWWGEALDFGRRAIEIEPMYEQGHRRMIRAWTGLGERVLALRHYSEFERWLQKEFGARPDPATTQLILELRQEMELAVNGHASAVGSEGPSAGLDDDVSTVANGGALHFPSVVRNGSGRTILGRVMRAIRFGGSRHGSRMME
jgi:DNA-binding SARP family transcriptional activator